MSHTNDDLASWLEARADEMAELVMALVAIDTENPPGRGLRECGAVLRAYAIRKRKSTSSKTSLAIHCP